MLVSFIRYMIAVDTREIVKLRIDSVGTEWIALSWESPCNSETNASITYSVERCDDKNFCDQKNETDTWHNATDLDLCTRYTFTVKILTDFWESVGINKSASTNNTSKQHNSIPKQQLIDSLKVKPLRTSICNLY